jgi:hypothetical protein
VLAAAIGILGCSLVFDVASSRAKEQYVYARGAYTLIGFGLVVGLLGLVLFIVELARWPRDSAFRRQGIRYLVSIDVLLGWFAMSFLIRHPTGTIQSGIALLGGSAVVFLAAAVCHLGYLRVAEEAGAELADIDAV